MATYYMKQHDTAPGMLMRLFPAEVDLTQADARLLVRMQGPPQTIIINRRAMEIVSPVDIGDGLGPVVAYDWQTGDTDVSGTYEMEVEVEYSNGRIETFPNAGYEILVISDDIDSP